MAADRTFDVIVVGAGIAGAAMAENLTDRGVRRVAVLEKESSYCTGASARSAGGVRQQFAEEAKIRAAMYSMACYERFAEIYGEDPGLKKHGYLVLATTRAGAAVLRRNMALQNRLGLTSRFLSPDEVGEVVAPLNTSDLQGATFSLEDGYLDPHALVQGYMKTFRSRGGVFEPDRRVVGFLIERGRVSGVTTTGGNYRAGAVVVAAGPFSGVLLERAGVRLPLEPCRRQIFCSGVVSGVEPHWPLVLDLDSSFYFRPETGGVIMSLAEVEPMSPPAEGNEIPLCRDHLDELARRATWRCPLLAAAEIRSGWAGLRTITPDERPLLGAVPGLEGLFVAAGFSGHGVTLAHFGGEVVSAAVVHEDPRCGDPAAFDPGRFA